MGIKHKLKRLKKQLKVLSQQTSGIAAGLAQVRVLIEQQMHLTEQHMALLQPVLRSPGTAESLSLGNQADGRGNGAAKSQDSNLAPVLELPTEAANQQAKLLQLQTENLARLLALLELHERRVE